MEKTAKIHGSFAEADLGDAAYYRSLTPTQRLDILLELVKDANTQDEAEPRIERVYRIVELAGS